MKEVPPPCGFELAEALRQYHYFAAVHQWRFPGTRRWGQATKISEMSGEGQAWLRRLLSWPAVVGEKEKALLSERPRYFLPLLFS
jgi:hypothetical protein